MASDRGGERLTRWDEFDYDELRIINQGLYWLNEKAYLDINDDTGFKVLAKLLEELDGVID